jgi:hypothetical protein
VKFDAGLGVGLDVGFAVGPGVGGGFVWRGVGLGVGSNGVLSSLVGEVGEEEGILVVVKDGSFDELALGLAVGFGVVGTSVGANVLSFLVGEEEGILVVVKDGSFDALGLGPALGFGVVGTSVGANGLPFLVGEETGILVGVKGFALGSAVVLDVGSEVVGGGGAGPPPGELGQGSYPGGISTASIIWITQPLAVAMLGIRTVAMLLMTTFPLATVMLSFCPVRLVPTSMGRSEDVVMADDVMAPDVTRWYRITLASCSVESPRNP